MTKGKNAPALEGEKWFRLSLAEVSSSFGVRQEIVLEIIDEGIIAVQKDDKSQWLFDEQSLRQIRTVLRLTHDLGVNFAGAGLALELLGEIESLRAELRAQHAGLRP